MLEGRGFAFLSLSTLGIPSRIFEEAINREEPGSWKEARLTRTDIHTRCHYLPQSLSFPICTTKALVD